VSKSQKRSSSGARVLKFHKVPEWAKPDAQFNKELAAVNRRIAAFIDQDHGETPLQSLDELRKTLAPQIMALLAGLVARQEKRWLAYIKTVDRSTLKRKGGRPRKSRPVQGTILGAGIPKSGPKSSDLSQLQSRIFQKRLTAERQGRRLARCDALAEVVADDIRNQSQEKADRLEHWQRHYEEEKGYSKNRALVSAVSKMERARYRGLQRLLGYAKTGRRRSK
jgi:hypothetical protein